MTACPCYLCAAHNAAERRTGPPVVTRLAHTRTTTDAGPDYCAECSHVAKQWIRWPCKAAARAVSPHPHSCRCDICESEARTEQEAQR